MAVGYLRFYGGKHGDWTEKTFATNLLVEAKTAPLSLADDVKLRLPACPAAPPAPPGWWRSYPFNVNVVFYYQSSSFRF